jgi:hypothetical protein
MAVKNYTISGEKYKQFKIKFKITAHVDSLEAGIKWVLITKYTWVNLSRHQ